MKNKRIIIILCFLFICIGVILLCSNIFALKTVNIEIQNNTSISTQTQKEICTQSVFKKNQSIFFIDKFEIISMLEEKYPNIKINSIETIFPNKLLINAQERKEIFYVKNSQNQYIAFDQTFKVLNIYTTQPNLTQVTGINAENAVIGKQLHKNQSVNILIDLYYNMYLAYYNEESFINFVKRCEYSENQLNIITKISGDVGLTIKIENACNNLTKKVIYALSAYNALTADQKAHGVILIQEHIENNNDIVVAYQE